MQDPTGKDPNGHGADAPEGAPRRLSPAAQRALAEAAERRAAIDARAAAISAKPERQGRGGLEPVRYDDWEVKGLAVDF
ncbi:DUF1674 domain-containing protein [Methylobacterium mesophilicum]|jgi:hypothetical protein|uniref:DUF1674 domain-containing protein n=1 Tax=Methylobacterium mesophilicum TaxID=39956 RepID=UPI0002C60901|nr:DUF1674 domain-containing protein [Methylobacterium mesophilicum]